MQFLSRRRQVLSKNRVFIWSLAAAATTTSLVKSFECGIRRHKSLGRGQSMLVSNDLEKEIDRRLAVAIISHPDSGKTTMSEKLLLYGDAIQEAGAVRARADRRRSRSDFLAMEKERGISISSTCLTFELDNEVRINLLDTPGHADFSEDTYRTLFACDNAVMLIDGGKGLEAQTRKLFHVARRSSLPVFTFINKFDRPAMSPWKILDEIEFEFNIECCIRTFPLGDGDLFRALYNVDSDSVFIFEHENKKKGMRRSAIAEIPANNSMALIQAGISPKLVKTFEEDREMIIELTPRLDHEKLLQGTQTTVYFGSAMTDVGVAGFLNDFKKCGARPAPRRLLSHTETAIQEAKNIAFSAVVFKLQANLDPRHRDSMAYVRIVSGRFEKGMKAIHTRSGRTLTLAQASLLFGSAKDSIEYAYPGDIIGLPNPSNSLFQIGDAIAEKPDIEFEPIPAFSPECFAYLRPKNIGASQKAFRKGLDQLLSEGAVQRLFPKGGTDESGPLLAAVGQLQFDVVQDRLRNEYQIDTTLEPISFTIARWVMPDQSPTEAWEKLEAAKAQGVLAAVYILEDKWQRPVLLFRNEFTAARLEDDLQLKPWAQPPSIKKQQKK